MKYTNAHVVFTRKRGRYSIGEKIAVIYCAVLGFLLFFLPILSISPISQDANTITYGLFHTGLLKSSILIGGAWLLLVLWSVSYRFKAFIHQTVGFKENESLFILFLLVTLTTAYISIGDISLLVKNNVTDTIKLTDGYFISSWVLLIGIVYTLRRSIVNAKHLQKASIYSVDHTKEYKKEVTTSELPENSDRLF